MSHIIKIEWLGGANGSPQPSEDDGRYVFSFNPDAHDGRGHLRAVDHPQDAMQFSDYAQAIAFYRQVSLVRPVRSDGKPNRPLTAFTVSICHRDKEIELYEHHAKIIRERVRDIDAGTAELIPHDEVMKWMEDRTKKKTE